MQRLLEALLTGWDECTPGQLGHTPDLVAVQCMEAVLSCAAHLLNRLSPSFQSEFSAALAFCYTLACSSSRPPFPHPFKSSTMPLAQSSSLPPVSPPRDIAASLEHTVG